MTEVNIVLPRKNFDVVIREDFSDGITGIFGPSGSGKTSLLHSISGLAIPREGKISIGDHTVFDSKERIHVPVEKRNIGYVFQEGRLFPHMSVEKNLVYGLKKDRVNKVNLNEVVELLNLGHLLKSKPSQISGGERQRTALGRSLLSSPDILLLDEPFSAVDTNLRNQILPFIIRIQQKVRIPILVVSHDLPDLLKLTNTLCLIKNGQCIGHGEYYDLLKNKAISEIFGANALVNSIDMHVRKITPENDLTILSWKQDNREVFIKCEKSKDKYNEGQGLKIFINADDIALSTEKLNNVTIQNQVEGSVTDIIRRGATLLCIVDTGFKLVVEITAQSQKRMDIQVGSKVWCLFKSVAIDVAG
jgi:molybdate transport system ATP-binding protein